MAYDKCCEVIYNRERRYDAREMENAIYRMVKEYHPEKITSEQQPKRKKGASQADIWRNGVAGRGSSKCKGPGNVPDVLATLGDKITNLLGLCVCVRV